jgi:tRNA uridine 5-carboxymethylaminomethyl modification enzyme
LLSDLVRRPGIDFDAIEQIAALARPDAGVSRAALCSELGHSLADVVIDQVEIAFKYAGYIDRQIEDVERTVRLEQLRLPPDLDYESVAALSYEVRQQLARHRPETLGQATRISGVTPAAISLLLVHLKKRRQGHGARDPSANDDTAADVAA